MVGLVAVGLLVAGLILVIQFRRKKYLDREPVDTSTLMSLVDD